MILAELEALLRQRRAAAEGGPGVPEGSYSVTLVTDPVRVQRKIMEEAFELCLELGRPSPDPRRTAEEAADLVFHILAGLVGAGVGLDAVLSELEDRRR
ncbi:MAG: phosphoribosyl-ATP diphosphatase [Nitriliruptorales bacterium]|nr:phosphoribosyl-ATP diphosphatase [Nitriliruptorales bacterium]